MVRRIGIALASTLVLGCAPRLDDRLFRIDGPRVIAVRAEPPEAAPGTVVTYRALQVSADGEISDAIDWAFCTERAPLASLGSVSPHCLLAAGDAIVPFGAPAIDAMGALPPDACRVFGPDVPAAGQAGDPPGRPVDPDPTGGYYQPVRLIPEATSDGAVAVERTRIRCGLASGTGDERVDFMHRYRANTNPALATLDLTLPDGTVTALDATMPTPSPIAIARGARVGLRAGWSDCPTTVDQLTDAGCAGAEPYLVYDGLAGALTERRETMRLAWFATAGTIATDQTGRGASDRTSFSDDTWVAPDVAGPASLWVVVRDDRGGVGWFRIDLLVST